MGPKQKNIVISQAQHDSIMHCIESYAALEERVTSLENELKAKQAEVAARSPASSTHSPEYVEVALYDEEQWLRNNAVRSMVNKKSTSLSERDRKANDSKGNPNTKRLDDTHTEFLVFGDNPLGLCLHCFAADRAPVMCVMLGGEQGVFVHRKNNGCVAPMADGRKAKKVPANHKGGRDFALVYIPGLNVEFTFRVKEKFTAEEIESKAKKHPGWKADHKTFFWKQNFTDLHAEFRKQLAEYPAANAEEVVRKRMYESFGKPPANSSHVGDEIRGGQQAEIDREEREENQSDDAAEGSGDQEDEEDGDEDDDVELRLVRGPPSPLTRLGSCAIPFGCAGASLIFDSANAWISYLLHSHRHQATTTGSDGENLLCSTRSTAEPSPKERRPP